MQNHLARSSTPVLPDLSYRTRVTANRTLRAIKAAPRGARGLRHAKLASRLSPACRSISLGGHDPAAAFACRENLPGAGKARQSALLLQLRASRRQQAMRHDVRPAQVPRTLLGNLLPQTDPSRATQEQAGEAAFRASKQRGILPALAFPAVAPRPAPVQPLPSAD